MNSKPITSQKEADEVLEFLIVQTMNTLKIKRLDAETRVLALRGSGILNTGNADDKISQIMIDAFLTSSQWDSPEYKKQIERLEKTRL